MRHNQGKTRKMGIWNDIKSLFTRPDGPPIALTERDKPLREHTAEVRRFLDGVDPSFPIEFYELIPKLVLVTPDLRQATSRTINLANTGLTFKLVGASKRMQERADIEIRNLLNNHPGLINRLLRQVATSGALSMEAIPSVSLSGIEELRIVPVRKIRFRREVVEGRDRFAPYEVRADGNWYELNLAQYSYEALEQEEESPYGIPPYISALRSVNIQRAGVSNIEKIMRKFGLFGFLSLLKKRPKPRPGEDDQTYGARLKRDLEQLRDTTNDRIRSGIIYSYDDIDVKHSTVSSDTRGFEQIWQTNEEQIASGADIDPALLGRSYSTTETYASVVFAAYVSKLANIRYPVERALKRAVDMHLRMLGYRFDRISAEWGEDPSMNREQDANADKAAAETQEIRQRTILALVAAGIIDLDQAAKELGYEKAALRKPPASLRVADRKVIDLYDVKKNGMRRRAIAG